MPLIAMNIGIMIHSIFIDLSICDHRNRLGLVALWWLHAKPPQHKDNEKKIEVEAFSLITSHPARKLTDPFGSPIIHRSFNIDSLRFGEGRWNHVVYISTAVELKEEA